MKYPLFKVRLEADVALENLSKVFSSGFINEGEQVITLEKELSSFLGVANLTLVNSCTSALTMALRIIGVGEGDEVITTAMTCVATNTPIINSGATLVWADIDSNTGMISAQEVEALITPKTKAIMIAEYADFTCFSFQAIKHFTTGDGGALICRNSDDHALAKKLKWFGYDRDTVKDAKGEWKGQKWDADILPEEVGYKFNLNNMSAAVGLANLPNMENVLSAHRNNAALLASLLSTHSKIKLLKIDPNALSSFWVYTLRLNVTEQQRDSIIAKLNEKGIGAGLIHLPNDRYSAFNEYRRELRNTKLFSATQISLPCGWWLSSNDIKIIAQALVDELDLENA